jgi:hypothetical protein
MSGGKIFGTMQRPSIKGVGKYHTGNNPGATQGKSPKPYVGGAAGKANTLKASKGKK